MNTNSGGSTISLSYIFALLSALEPPNCCSLSALAAFIRPFFTSLMVTATISLRHHRVGQKNARVSGA